ncbi:hypothetical protein GCM10011611_30630 [Aliidongia dinghuensis]|uniref:Uncharacterized protein n=1 Tax=Aliidongia dinghuensis TaxID=1867774 RepID=A0A8J2YUD5_9PROT|nr:hypothetical protein [Aliidongia dinghuensis]GGF22409.1 hypothetical protein GCM10011611_30630 [Aliidongia dinghuensis]
MLKRLSNPVRSLVVVLGLAAAALAMPAMAPPAGAATVIQGQNALAGATAKVAGTLTAMPAGQPTDLKLEVALTQTGQPKPITKYDADLGKAMHIIAISEDFSVFIHRHVEHVIDGNGQVRIRFPKPALYHIYVDAMPHTLGQQVLRFDLPVGDAPATGAPKLKPGTLTAESGPYQVTFDSLDLSAGEPSMLTLHILENGKPAKDLKPFLGVGAHVVLIAADGLDYVHVHPMSIAAMTGGVMSEGAMSSRHDMPGMAPSHDAAPHEAGSAEISPDMMLHVAVPKPGLYKLWVQFDGGRTLYTLPFVATAH